MNLTTTQQIILHFNTSNVTIQPSLLPLLQHSYSDFNTSNVTIQRSCFRPDHIYQTISIHLMLLFNGQPMHLPCSSYSISIHLMLLFNPCHFAIYLLLLVISIHLMLLFNPLSSISLVATSVFQYI